MLLMMKRIVEKIKERIIRQTAVLVSSVSVLTIVVLASNEVGAGDINTLTAFAETNFEVAESAEEELKEGEEKGVNDLLANEGDSETTALKEKLLLNEKTVEENKKTSSEETEKEVSAVVPCSQEDYQILLRIVQAEAGICDDTGKVLVANVILNRVRDEEFPDTIKEVVYQPSQFSPVANGTINTCKVTQQTVDCVNRALSGEDYSQGALYFMNRSGARSGAANWFDGRLTFLFQHEKHEFFK